MNKIVFFLVILFPLCLYPLYWIQEDWSGGDGQDVWADSTRYLSGFDVNGWRGKGCLFLNAPDVHNWNKTGDLGGIAHKTYCLLEKSGGSIIYAGTACLDEIGRIFKSTDQGENWEVDSILYYPPNAIYSLLETPDGSIFAGGNTNIYKYDSIDTIWKRNHLTSVPIWDFVSCKGYIYAGGGNYVYILEEANWVPRPVDMTQLFSIESYNDEYVYAGGLRTNKFARLLRSSNRFISYDTTASLDTARTVYDIVETEEGNLLASTGNPGGVFSSSDGGTSWSFTYFTDFDEVRTLIQTDDGKIYAGTYPNATIFKSEDGGDTWESVFSFSDTYWIYDFLQLGNGLLLASTSASGTVWRSGYFTEGYLISSFYPTDTLNGSAEYFKMTVNVELNSGEIVVRVRTLSDLNDTLPKWEDCPPCSCGDGENQFNISSMSSITDGEGWIQYRMDLKSGNPANSPWIEKITIKYSCDFEGPRIESAVASDGVNGEAGIDGDDYITIVFDEPTDTPHIESSNINSILHLSSNHTWLDGFGFIRNAKWLSPESLKIELSVNGTLPTVEVGDTIFPDSVTIKDTLPVGNGSYKPFVITGSFGPTHITEMNNLTHKNISLFQIYPNPFNSFTVIRYSLPSMNDERITNNASLKIYDASGRLICTFPIIDNRSPITEVVWDGRDSYGRRMVDGVYFLSLTIGGNTIDTKKVVLLKR